MHIEKLVFFVVFRKSAKKRVLPYGGEGLKTLRIFPELRLLRLPLYNLLERGREKYSVIK